MLIDKVWYLVITYYLKFYQYYQDTFSCSSYLLVKTIIIIICNYQQNIGDLTPSCLFGNKPLTMTLLTFSSLLLLLKLLTKKLTPKINSIVLLYFVRANVNLYSKSSCAFVNFEILICLNLLRYNNS